MSLDLDHHARALRKLKEASGWRDLGPQLMLVVDGRLTMAVLVTDDVAAGVAVAVAALKPTEVMVLTDAYMEVADTTAASAAEAAEHFHGGDLGARFAAGDAAIRECLMLLTYDGIAIRTKVLPYDGRRHVWLPETHLRDDLVGRLAMAIKAGWWAGWEQAHG